MAPRYLQFYNVYLEGVHTSQCKSDEARLLEPCMESQDHPSNLLPTTEHTVGRCSQGEPIARPHHNEQRLEPSPELDKTNREN